MSKPIYHQVIAGGLPRSAAVSKTSRRASFSFETVKKAACCGWCFAHSRAPLASWWGTVSRYALAGLLCAAAVARGADTVPKFLGANGCSSSSCHGGGGAKQNQFLVWSLKDFHSHRPPATLTTARSKQIADALQIPDPTTETRCTTCHAPLRDVPEDQRGENFKVSEGVSCESCHGPAESWLRAHTRHDWTRADRTAAGMRDLQNLYVRASTCVACHQNVDADILKAGHPELMFELDGQSVAEPKHWRAEKDGNGAQAWLVGQAVALREMSWQLSKVSQPDTNTLANQSALFSILEQVSTLDNQPTPAFKADDFAAVQKWADDLARSMADTSWTDTQTKKCLTILANTAIKPGGAPNAEARRVDRLVLAFDRLVTAQPELKSDEPVQSALNKMFKLAQSIPDFDAAQFAAAQADFSKALTRSTPAVSSP